MAFVLAFQRVSVVHANVQYNAIQSNYLNRKELICYDSAINTLCIRLKPKALSNAAVFVFPASAQAMHTT